MAFLTITSGEMEGQKVELDQDDITIGRSDQNSLSLDDPAISGKHCLVKKEGNKYTLKDLNSTNGTRLNGRNIVEVRLKPGDIIMLGAIELTIDGTDIEIEPEHEPLTRANTTPTVIIAPARNVARNLTGSSSPSPAFQTKKDNRPLLIGLAVIGFILVAAAMGWFLMQVFKK